MQGWFTKATATIGLMAMLAMPVLAPTPALAKKNKKKPVDVSKLVWPPAPEITRLRWITEVHGEDVKGVKKQGFLERLAGVQDYQSKSLMMKPQGVVADSAGHIFVSDSVLSVVFMFDLEKKTMEYRGDKPPAALKRPSGLAVDDKDRLFVGDFFNHNVTVFEPNGDAVTVFGDDELKRPAGLAIDSELRRLYVADTQLRKIAQFNLDSFKFERWVGISADEKAEPGDADKILLSPTNMLVDPDGLLYVVDTFMDRIVVFDTDGEFVRRIGDVGQGPGKFMRPKGIAMDSDGHIYITDAMFHLFQILMPDGRPLIPVGRLGEDPGQFSVPMGITVDKLDRVIVVDQQNHRIQVFKYTTDADADKQKATQTASAKGNK